MNHKDDVFRLLANVLPSSKVEIDEKIEADIRLFIEMIDHDRPDLKNLGIKGVELLKKQIDSICKDYIQVQNTIL
jgi:hypothetical protein